MTTKISSGAIGIVALVLACIGDDQFMDSLTDPGTTTSGWTGDPTTTSGTTTSGTTTAGTTTGTSGPDTTTIQETTSQTFVIDGDAGGTVECSVWVQDCPEGQKCAPYSSDDDDVWDGVHCVPVMENPGKPGDKCTVQADGDTCEKGAVCYGIDGMTGEGTCVEQCEGSPRDPKCETPGTICVIANDDVFTLCLPTCDPLVQDCPGQGVCVPDPQNMASFVCLHDASGAEGQEWDACESPDACDPGLYCGAPQLASECDQDAAGCCLPYCDLTNPMCKGVSQECIPWYDMGQAPMGYEDVGMCAIP